MGGWCFFCLVWGFKKRGNSMGDFLWFSGYLLCDWFWMVFSSILIELDVFEVIRSRLHCIYIGLISFSRIRMP